MRITLKYKYQGSYCHVFPGGLRHWRLSIWQPRRLSMRQPSLLPVMIWQFLYQGYTGFNLSVCPSVDRILSDLHLQQYSSDPCHIYSSCQATSECVLCGIFFKIKKFEVLTNSWICNFDFVYFWLGIQYETIVCIIMGQPGVSSGHRGSSCSSYFWQHWKLSVCNW